jgi:endonuclease/exonuclease/phosphatase family metal-dependent hydrolase
MKGVAWILVVAGLVLEFHPAAFAETESPRFRVATYNLENYIDQHAGTRPLKTAEAKAGIRNGLRLLNADVVALQEVGSTNTLLELRASLKNEGLDYPHWELVMGWDTNIHVAILSKFPITARRPHTNDSFLLLGRRHRVSRGFAEVDLRVSEKYSFTLMTAHLKSRRPVPEADEAELREQEAILLREHIDARLASGPNVNLVVLGDFNDSKDTKAIRALIGRGKTALIDTRPAERNGDTLPNANHRGEPRNVSWTHYYGKEDSYSRLDYILISKGLAAEWDKENTYVLTMANWGQASDHRPVVAGFFAEDR